MEDTRICLYSDRNDPVERRKEVLMTGKASLRIMSKMGRGAEGKGLVLDT